MESIKVPIEIPQREPAPLVSGFEARARRSLHNVRMSRTAPVEAEAPPPVEQPTYSQPAQYQPQEVYMDNQQGNQQPQTLQRPDASMVDWYDPQAVQQYHEAEDRYLDQRISAGIQAANAQSRHDQQFNDVREQYNSCFAKYGDDGNFKEAMNDALALCDADDKAGKPVNIEARYLEVSDATSRRSGERLSHLPSKARSIKGLGQLIEFHHQRGTARPFNGRNWRG